MNQIKKCHEVVSNLNLVQGRLQGSIDSMKESLTCTFQQHVAFRAVILLVSNNMTALKRVLAGNLQAYSFEYETAKAMHQVL